MDAADGLQTGGPQGRPDLDPANKFETMPKVSTPLASKDMAFRWLEVSVPNGFRLRRLSVKSLIRALAVGLCLLLVPASPNWAGAMPDGIPSRPGRGLVASVQSSSEDAHLTDGADMTTPVKAGSLSQATREP